MKNSVILQEVIFTSISRDLKFSSDTYGAVESLALFNALVDASIVVLEVERVIVETAESHFDVKLSQFHLRRYIKLIITHFVSFYNWVGVYLINYDSRCQLFI